ncbi:MAG: WYL domain-containing protein [Thermoleophilia bacterium]
MTPPAGPPREEGFSKDADKLIRRLSLVAFLLSRPGRPAAATEIRQRVEGYALMTDDAFKRRFYEDRAELAALGIGIASDADGEGDIEVYSLPAAAYYLPAIAFTPDELSALAACLFVLEHRFAYSEPLRLALLSLTHSRPELLSPATATPVSVLPEREARRAATALPKLQQAVAAGKTVTFRYYSIGRDEELERTVDPYGLLLVGDEWYLIAFCHLRQAIRTFRLSRLRSRVVFATRAPHDFAPPAHFSIDDYLDRPPWQLGEPVGSATVRVTADMAWWVVAHFTRCGTITPAPGDDASNDGIASDAHALDAQASDPHASDARASDAHASGAAADILYSTTYNSPQQLVAWVLSMGAAAELLEPRDLRAELRAQLLRLAARLAEPPLGAPKAAALLGGKDVSDGSQQQAAAGGAGALRTATPGAGSRAAGHGPAAGDADWEVEVDRFTRLATLMTYLHGVCRAAGGADETPVPVTEVCSALDTTPAELTSDVRLLNLVNFGGEGTLVWAELKGASLVVTCDVASSAFARPARLSPLQVDTLLLAVEILGGQLPIVHGAALRSAADKLRWARSAAPPAVAAGERLPTAEPILDAVNAAVGQRRLLDIEYWSEGSGTTTTRTVEPYLLVRTRGEWYYVAWCRRSGGTRTFRVATTKRALLRSERFNPRPEVEVELYRREGIRSSERYAPRRADVWYGPAVARWVAEREPTVSLPGGACLARQPYVDERWLTHELLRFGGEALPLSPPAAVDALDEVVARLVERYA